jgi:hypothetical protein
MWHVNVLLNDVTHPFWFQMVISNKLIDFCLFKNFVNFSWQKDSFTLAKWVRLYYVGDLFFLADACIVSAVVS